jgi:glutamate:Na+ symporter, ESS family
MEITIVEGLRTLKFDLVLTLALAALFLFTGYAIQRRVRFLARSSIPAPVIGGLLFALIVLALRARASFGITLDTSLRAPLQTAFFTTIGFGATLSLLRRGGWRMPFFWLIASLTAVAQTLVGIALARALNAPPALGIICGALTLTGGPATGLAFADAFQQMGIDGANAVIIASATFGIFTASLVGNPLAALLIRRRALATTTTTTATTTTSSSSRERTVGPRAQKINGQPPPSAQSPKEPELFGADKTEAGGGAQTFKPSPRLTGGALLHYLLLILLIMGAGALLSLCLTRAGVTLPGYVGAMVIAAVARNVYDRAGRSEVNTRALETLAAITLALFLIIALMDLKLWQLAGLAVPMLIILAVQVVLMVVYAAFVTFVLMGRDYEAAVTASGHIGFGLGITPNAVANMEALTGRYGPAPQSFLVVPIVGAFFIDFSNALIITLFINLIR